MPRITPVRWQDLEKVFLLAGFRFARQEDSHRSYVKAGVLRPIVIPTYQEVPVSIIRNNLKTAGISRDEYFRLLGGTGSHEPRPTDD
jgi:predicted RNA binding protein YcfA (HicA-like mRNA interferase family)